MGRPEGPALLVSLILVFSAVVLVGDLDWCIEGNEAFSHSIHSDEQRKVDSVLQMRLSLEGMRPSRFLMAKGTLLPTLGRLVYEAVDRSPLRHGFALLYGVEHDGAKGTYLLLRSISAACSLALTYLIFRLTFLLSGKAYAGVIAAFLFTTTFGASFSAVIFKSDMLLATLIGALLLAVTRYVCHPSASRASVMGAVFGVAVAAKYLGVLAIVIPIVGWAILPARRARLKHALLAGVSSVVSLFLTAPFLFLDHRSLLAALRYQARMQTTHNYHFEGFGFQPKAVLAHLLVPSLGSVFTAAALAGVAYAVFRSVRRREYRLYLPLLSYLVVHYAALSLNSWLVVRYTIPLYPVLAALAGIVLCRAIEALLGKRTLASRLAVLLILSLGGLHAFRFLAFNRLLEDPTSTVKATTWLRKNLPESSRVLEIRRRPPLVYGFSDQPVARLTASAAEEMIARGERLSALDVDYVVVTERSFRQFFRLRSARYSRHRSFFSELFDNRRFALLGKFETKARFLGVTFSKGFLPQDLVLISPDTYVFAAARRQETAPAR